ncbi:hypothetical protein GH714_038321 [Hevea brasiliensis]|uniref:Myb/SANT-like DNA-binding domain-containing protein n=1 Tax=Hevea brasiliensis TaxID=3981 RepID=A0A6A6MN97_HEVBR|nr:hypothetical protein GH714_038321 [Hevea brasiliensis]
MSTPTDSIPRRVPPPCWTQEETIALIEAYRDKWYSVNRGNLRAADWDSVAAAVADSATADTPKSSLQCRHKIEKLRKRYRTEKQRCLNYPGRFFPSWDLFPLLDSMAIGSAGPKQCQDIDEENDIGDGFRVKTLGDRYLITPNRRSNIDQDFDADFDSGLDSDLAFRATKYSRIEEDSDSNVSRALGNGFCLKPVGDVNSVSVAFRPKDHERVDGKLKADIDFHCDYEGGVCMKMEKTQCRSFLPQGPRLKGYGKIGGDSSPINRSIGEGADTYVGFPVKTLGDVPPGFKPKNSRKVDEKSFPNLGNDNRFAENIIDGLVSPLPGFRPKNNGKIDGSLKLDVDSKVLNGFGNVKKGDVQSGGKKVMDPIAEAVSAIKMSTKSFVKVEKMKMEMAMEIEKMRMDMLLKHNQMILESQQQIADAFAKKLLEKKEKKRKEVDVLSPYQKKNGGSQVAATDCESIGRSGILKEECEGALI